MSLGKKTVLLFLVLGISFCFGAYVALKLTVFPAFEEFENRSAIDTLARVDRLLESDLRALEIMNIEYSAWDDTYEYALGQRPDYADENIDPDYWHALDIQFMAVFDTEGTLLNGSLTNPISGAILSFDDVFETSLGPGNPLIKHETATDFVAGLLQTRIGPMHIVSYPILTSKSTGPVAGTLLIGKFLTDDHVKELGERATAEVAIHPLNSSNLPGKVAAGKHALIESEESAHLITDELAVYTYQLLPSVFGDPAFIVEVGTPREIIRMGTNTVRTATLFLAVASIVFLLAAWVFMHRLITEPVTRLTRLILGMRHTGDLNVDVSGSRSDEVGQLAREFGELASKLKAARSELEEARDSAVAMSDAKSEFLARMSHEIRTPMNGVLGMTELLRDTTLNEQQQRFAKTIHESAESLLQIINDILDISKIEAGKIELDIAPLNLRNMVEDCLDTLAETAHRKGLELICAIPPETHTCVRGDPVRLRQVLMNLIGNAVKFTEQGEIAVRVVESGRPEGNYRFEVSDTGVGIRSENAAKIFEPFSQEDGSTTRRYGGTGLGLSISKQLVELMDGEIGVDSALGEGCVFWFTAKLPKDEATSELPQPGLFFEKNVLIVDDNATNLEILSHQLEGWGMRVTAAASGAEALELLAGTVGDNDEFDVMLLDMGMPDMDGLQLAQAVKGLSARSRVPIVMLSSLSRADLSAEQTQISSENWLTKPVRQTQLYDVLQSVLSNAAVEVNVASLASPTGSASDYEESDGLRILLADDNVVNREVAVAMLKTFGHQITSVSNGKKALEAVKKHNFDIVLMDCRMPEMDGYDAARAIRQWEEQHGQARIPIAALTANALQGDRQACLDAGMDDYLSKPFTKVQLGTVIDSARTRVIAGFQDSADRNARILVVDDNIVNQQVACAMLASLGRESLAVSGGDEALHAMSAEKFDMVLMDCHMPGRDGYDTTREIRRREKRSSDRGRVPVVALTADFLESNRQRCADSGMDDYATKPITQEHLRLLLQRWLGESVSDQSSHTTPIDADGFSSFGDSTTLASIDRQALQEIRDLDTTPGATVLREIVVSYCACSTKLMLQLRVAVDDGDAALIEQAAHSIKGASSQIGAVLLAAICDELIVSANGGDLKNSHALCERAAIEHSAVISGLDKELQTIAA